MTLTPEDVINKRFQPTKFREGYDQDEVDDFLDEIVVELRRLSQENEELRKQVETSGGRVSPSQYSDSEASSAVAPQEPQYVQETAPAPVVAPQPTASATPTTASAAPTAASSAPTESVESAAGVLAMAQKLHDEYVSQGRSERERLITEGRSEADKLVSEGKRNREEILSTLEREKSQLEASVSQLRTFEREYRGNLKDYLAGQLRQVESTGSLAPSHASAGDGGSRAAVN